MRSVFHAIDRENCDLLNDLISSIDRIKQTIQLHKESLTQNETKTRTVLIEPLLSVLGWDVTNLDVVKVEYNTSAFDKSQADYALFNDDKAVVIVEAKKLKEQLRKHATQMVGYAIEEGIPYAILTDGNVWEMYEVFQAKSLLDKKILDVNLTTSSTASCALNLLLLWRSNIELASPIKVRPPIVNVLAGDPPPPKPPWISFDEFVATKNPSRPKYVRFWDDSTVPVATWTDLFVVCARKAISSGNLKEAQLPLFLNKNLCYVHTKPEHPSGQPFRRSIKIDTRGIFVFTHGNAKQLRDRVKLLWEASGLALSTLYVET